MGNVRRPRSLPARRSRVSELTSAPAASQWTRFANHVCEGFNVAPRSVYIDDCDVSRPLLVYFALRDIWVRAPSLTLLLERVPATSLTPSRPLARSPARRSRSRTPASPSRTRSTGATRARSGRRRPTSRDARPTRRTAATVRRFSSLSLSLSFSPRTSLTLGGAVLRRWQGAVPRAHVQQRGGGVLGEGRRAAALVMEGSAVSSTLLSMLRNVHSLLSCLSSETFSARASDERRHLSVDRHRLVARLSPAVGPVRLARAHQTYSRHRQRPSTTRPR